MTDEGSKAKKAIEAREHAEEEILKGGSLGWCRPCLDYRSTKVAATVVYVTDTETARETVPLCATCHRMTQTAIGDAP